VGDSGRIHPSTLLVLLIVSTLSCLACAKGTDISPSEIVILTLLPPENADAGADAAAAPNGATSDEVAPVTTDTEP
jgi:hypothetical protein